MTPRWRPAEALPPEVPAVTTRHKGRRPDANHDHDHMDLTNPKNAVNNPDGVVFYKSGMAGRIRRWCSGIS